jgi:hypothetical protein
VSHQLYGHIGVGFRQRDLHLAHLPALPAGNPPYYCILPSPWRSGSGGTLTVLCGI